MAKVVGPLHSDDARGQLGKSIVFMGWKGVKSARMWLKPANPKSETQGDVRTILGAVGRVCGKVKTGSNYHEQMITLESIPAGQSKQSFLVKFIRDSFFSGDAATMKTNYNTIKTEYGTATAKDKFESEAAALGLSDFKLVYAGVDTFTKGMQLYMLAKAAYALSFSGAPYTTAPADWAEADVTTLVSDIAAPSGT